MILGIKVMRAFKKLIGSAVASDVRLGKTFVGAAGELETGTAVMNYDGYKIVYGSKTLSEVKSAGAIPLTLRFRLYSSVTDATKIVERAISITFSGYSSIAVETAKFQTSTVGSYVGDYWMEVDVPVIELDLDRRCSGDLTKCSKVTGVTNASSLTVAKWLEPISSGGGQLES